jgi:hypothetical protein
VDITGAVAHRLGENQIDELDDGRLSVMIQNILRPFQVMRQATQRLIVQILNHLRRGLRSNVVQAIERPDDFPLRAQNWLDRCLEEHTDIIKWL